MKNYLKASNWLRLVKASVFAVMLLLNIMVSLEFDTDKVFPSITLIELGNKAMAQGETGGGNQNFYRETDYCQNYYQNCIFTVTKCRYTGGFSCETWMQTPCSLACGY
ncbi:hypothetical protein [Arthrospiribacter ruber]|uniref:Uncharacterized protein n=1 Tax=Arthrospiribacter ruber TaxID=2487934 RepID=A0A951MD63_9BACT|nr:hypothetical protein [Arthrospiribacter ruber]MBW3466971.1 hypothetical protein [Arthrospiribacter ruber]